MQTNVNSTSLSDLRNASTRPHRYRADIDGLRAIAVLGVLFCHAALWMPGGYVGVDVFFVISGFLITSIIVRDIQADRFSFANFWERRVRRIFPALAAVLISTTIAAWFILIPADLATYGSSTIWVTAMAANIFFWRTTDYFDVAAEEKPLLHTWSLGVEEQFYIFIPLAIVLFYRWQHERRVPALFAFFSIASFVLSVYGTAYRPAGTFYLLPTRAWELFAGCLLAMGWFPRLTHRKTLREALSILGLGFILTPFFLYTSDTSFPGVAAVPAVLGATLIIGTGAEKTTYVGRALSNGWLAYIGLISYSLYLWHWPIFAFARYVSIAELSIGTRVTLCVASIVAGALSMHLVEKPFRERRLAASRRGIVTLAMTTMFCLCGAGVAARIAEGVPLRLSEQQQAYQTSAMSDSRWSRALDIEDLPSSLLKFGLDSENVQVLVWGDSHARAMLPAIDKACVQYGLTGVGAIRSANPPALNMAGKSHLGGNEKAIPFNKKVVELLKQKPFQAVFMVAYWDIYLDDPEFAEKFCQTIREVTDLGIQVYVVSDVPRYSFEVPRFVITYSGLGLPIDLLGKTKTEHLRDSQGFAELAPEIEKAGGQILEPADHLLTSEDGHSYLPASSKDCLYSDSHHLSAAGAILLLPLFEQALQSHALASDNSAGLQE